MKKRSVVALSTLAAGALAVAGSLPASAAVTYKATAESAIGSFPSLDSSTNTIYSTKTTATTSGGIETDTVLLVATDAKTYKQKSTLTLAQYDPDAGGPVGIGVTDLRVNSKTHTVWMVLKNAAGTDGEVMEANGSTMKLLRTIDEPVQYETAGTLAVNPTTNTAYVAWSWTLWYGGDDSQVPLLEAINGTTGATTLVDLPAPAADESQIYPYGLPGNVAFDSSNNGVYVGFNSHEYAYSNSTLKLASSVAFPASETTTDPTLTADGSTHTIYAVGSSTLYKITGSSNTIAASVSITATGSSATSQPTVVPVVDPTIKTLYIGTRAYSETSLAETGTIPHAATSVSGSTHTIYSPGYITTRSGS